MQLNRFDLNLLIALIGGSLAGLGLALALEQIDDGGRTPVPRRGRIRRCSVRHVAILPVRSGSAASVEVACLLGGIEHPLPLGTMDEARPICNACTARSVWRADED
jgi:hypothetical protein